MLACKHLDRILRASGSPSVWPHSYNACRKLLLHKQWEISFQFWKKNDFYNLTLLIQFLKYEWICSSKKTSNLTLWIFRVFTYWEINFPCVENLLPECCQDQVHIDRRTRICIHSAKYIKKIRPPFSSYHHAMFGSYKFATNPPWNDHFLFKKTPIKADNNSA